MKQQQSTKRLHIDTTTQPNKISISGDWVVADYHCLLEQTKHLSQQLAPDTQFDFSQLGALDTAGATLLVKLLGEQRIKQLSVIAPELPAERRVLLDTVGKALDGFIPPVEAKRDNILTELVLSTGQIVDNLWQDIKSMLAFIGLTLSTLFSSLWRPSHWRITSLVANIQQVGLNAVPIIILLTFLVGAVIAFLGATVLTTFGAGIFTVNLVVFSFLREFAVLLTAILMAGRTASAFTAQIGLMKANEEIDAIQAIGLNPVELLVLPRVLALLFTLPMLTFIGMLFGILGGIAVCTLTMDISLNMFLSITQNSGAFQHFLVGMSKAPIFAFLIAIIGCMEGFKVTGSAESVGTHTTASVVHSIFVVILVDAIAALFFMEMGW